MIDNLETIKQKIKEAKAIVYFGGAGTSTESEIPDFRTESGLYNQPEFAGRDPQVLLSTRTLYNEPELFYAYYRSHRLFPNAKPNKAHKVLARWEQEGKLKAVITQNIDGLHQMAGSQNVLELHGSVHRNYCTECQQQAELDEITDSSQKIPLCRHCGGMLRPDVVFFGEPLDQNILHQAVKALKASDFLIVGGTSLVVYPAAGLIDYFEGKNMLLINRDKTPFDNRATWVIHDSIGEVLWQLAEV